MATTLTFEEIVRVCDEINAVPMSRNPVRMVLTTDQYITLAGQFPEARKHGEYWGRWEGIIIEHYPTEEECERRRWAIAIMSPDHKNSFDYIKQHFFEQMAKAVITVEDTEDGMVRTCVEFDPVLKADARPTNAQGAAMAMLTWINAQPGEDLEIE